MKLVIEAISVITKSLKVGKNIEIMYFLWLTNSLRFLLVCVGLSVVFRSQVGDRHKYTFDPAHS